MLSTALVFGANHTRFVGTDPSIFCVGAGRREHLVTGREILGSVDPDQKARIIGPLFWKHGQCVSLSTGAAHVGMGGTTMGLPPLS
jgi:hypothetical protein